MNPPTRQKPIHHRSLRREHIRILLLPLRLALRGRQSRAIVDRLTGRGRPARVDETGWVRRRAEFVWLREGAALVGGGVLGFCGCGAGGCEAAGWGVEGSEGLWTWEAAGEEEARDCWGGWWHGGWVSPAIGSDCVRLVMAGRVYRLCILL